MPPPKKVKETEAIFAQLQQTHDDAQQSPTVLRLSLDAKATINLGPFARGGRTRLGTEAADHDFKPTGTLTPFGLLLPDHDELNLYFTSTKVSSDFIVDVLDDWWRQAKERFTAVKELLLYLDNGPENSGCRSQFLYRLVLFARLHQVQIRLAYYPPYHSKYNPIERCWGALENYWGGELLHNEEAVLGFARNLRWKGKQPQVTRVTQTYTKGVRRTRAEKKQTEKQLQRLPGLGKWFITIPPQPLDQVIT